MGRTYMRKEKILLFQGSKERLKRSVARCGGTFLENQNFEIVWRSKYFQRGLAYRFRCRYEKTDEAYQITYTCVPTAGTFLRMLLLTGGLLLFAVQECAAGYYESAMGVCLFSMLYPALAVWQGVSCRKAFCRFFSVVTGSKAEKQE